jgi:ribosomal protein S18 acetylase RimI-like enzyme
MSLRGPAGVVHDLVVDLPHRGRGLGRLLLEATLETIEARGVPQIVLHTAARNGAAKRLFARAGFRETMVEMTRDAGVTSTRRTTR